MLGCIHCADYFVVILSQKKRGETSLFSSWTLAIMFENEYWLIPTRNVTT